MAISESLLSLRDRIARELPAPGATGRRELCGLNRFTPSLEMAVLLQRAYERSSGLQMDYTSFSRAYVDLLLAERPCDLAVERWNLADLDAQRLALLVDELGDLPDALGVLFFSLPELEAMAPDRMVALLYETLLGRSCSPEEIVHWIEYLDGENSIANIIQGISTSQEARRMGPERRLVIVDTTVDGQAHLLRGYRCLQDLELARLFDMAKLAMLLER